MKTRRQSPSSTMKSVGSPASSIVIKPRSSLNCDDGAEGTVSHGNAIFEWQFIYICGVILKSLRSNMIRLIGCCCIHWKSAPKHIQCLFVVICLFLIFECLSYPILWCYGKLREFYLLQLPISEQWVHFKRNNYLSHDIFEPVPVALTDYFESSSIAIVGMIRNHDHTLDALLKQLDNLSCFFAVSAVLIYESNSDDDTPRILKQWSRRGNEQNALCQQFDDRQNPENLFSDKNMHSPTTKMVKTLLDPDSDPNAGYEGGSRLDKYSRYRNYLLDEVIALDIDFDFFAPIDLDVYALDIRGILKELEIADRANISVMCVNGIGRSGFVYDSLATVVVYPETESTEKDWPRWAIHKEQWEMHHIGDHDRGRLQWFYYLDEIYRSNIIYSKSNNLTEAMSCFGAMAFYNFRDIMRTKCRYDTSAEAVSRYPALSEFYYTNRFNGDVGICEHIPFNYCLYSHGLRLVISRNAYLYYGMFHNR